MYHFIRVLCDDFFARVIFIGLSIYLSIHRQSINIKHLLFPHTLPRHRAFPRDIVNVTYTTQHIKTMGKGKKKKVY